MEHDAVAKIIRRAYEEQAAQRFDEAMETLGPVLALETPPACVLTLAGECLLLRDEAENAGPLLRRAVDLAPRGPDQLLELAHYLHVHGQFTGGEERELLARAKAEIAKLEVSAALLEASIHFDCGRYTEEREVLQQAVDRHPENELLRERLMRTQG